jgi:hypothetical protein
MAKENIENNQRIVCAKEDQRLNQEILLKERSEIRQLDHEERRDMRITAIEMSKQTSEMVRTCSSNQRLM